MLNYDLEYYERMLRINTKTAEEICRIRWEWIARLNPKVVLDYGSGVGWFRAFRPKGIVVNSYDIGNYPQTGIRARIYDVICLWDVLEHMKDFRRLEVVLRLCNAVACTVPIKPETVEWNDWHHFKPNEHYHYFTIETLDELMKRYGFSITRSGMPECPPRKDIKSFLFTREVL